MRGKEVGKRKDFEEHVPFQTSLPRPMYLLEEKNPPKDSVILLNFYFNFFYMCFCIIVCGIGLAY